jgi:hypothetical protein
MSPIAANGAYTSQTDTGAETYYGKYRGTVTNNQDPRNQGRIRALVPEVLGDVESGWALPCAPYGGDGIGAYTIPPPETAVWIEFEAGDVCRPIWSGCWWAEDQLPKDHTGSPVAPPIKVIRTENGLMLALNDESQTIALSDENGNNILEINIQGGRITIKGGTKAVVEAPQIELVENATHPVAFGDELMQYLSQLVQIYQSHMHPGQTVAGIPVTPAPPVPPMPPPTPTLVSTKVKTG